MTVTRDAALELAWLKEQGIVLDAATEAQFVSAVAALPQVEPQPKKVKAAPPAPVRGAAASKSTPATPAKKKPPTRR